MTDKYKVKLKITDVNTIIHMNSHKNSSLDAVFKSNEEAKKRGSGVPSDTRLRVQPKSDIRCA